MKTTPAKTTPAKATAVKATDETELRRASRRLAVQFAVLIMALFAIFGGVVFAIVNGSADQSIQRTLLDASRIDSPRDAPSGVFVMTLEEDKPETPAELPPGLPDEGALRDVAQSGVTLQQTKTIDGHDYTIRTTREKDHVIQVAIDLHENQEELRRLGSALIISGILAGIAAGLVAAWMARRAMRPMAEALALQRRFVMDASHELRTPLTLLSTRAQLVRRRLSTTGSISMSDIGVGLDEIAQDSRALAEILEDLLIAADPREMAHTIRLDVTALADDAVDHLQSDAGERGITLRRTGSTQPVVVTGARISLQRLFTALVTNALDHATDVVELNVTGNDREAMIRVVDDGPGFPQGMDAHAFERFATSRPTTPDDRRPRNYGLGLALVAEVATRHQGSVTVEDSLPGHGATVTVRIPSRA